ASHGLHLGTKTHHLGGARMAAGQEHLQRAQSIKPDLPCLVDDPHSPTPQFLHHLVTEQTDVGPSRGGSPWLGRDGRGPSGDGVRGRGRWGGSWGASCGATVVAWCRWPGEHARIISAAKRPAEEVDALRQLERKLGVICAKLLNGDILPLEVS